MSAESRPDAAPAKADGSDSAASPAQQEAAPPSPPPVHPLPPPSRRRRQKRGGDEAPRSSLGQDAVSGEVAHVDDGSDADDNPFVDEPSVVTTIEPIAIEGQRRTRRNRAGRMARGHAEQYDDTTQEIATPRDSTEVVRPFRPILKAGRGLWGDLRYVFDSTRARFRIRADIKQCQVTETTLQEHQQLLIAALGRAALADAALILPDVVKARDEQAELDAQRDRGVVEVAAASDDIAALRADHRANAAATALVVEQLQQQIAALTETRTPLEQHVAEQRQRLEDIQRTLRSLDEHIQNIGNRLATSATAELGVLQAELAAVRAEREVIARDEAETSAAIAEVMPQIADCQAQQDEAEAAITATWNEDRTRQERIDQKLVAAQERQRLADEAVAAAEARTQDLVQHLGEALCDQRPSWAEAHLRALDHCSAMMTATAQRSAELHEALLSIDRSALFRGIGILVALVMMLVAVVWYLAT